MSESAMSDMDELRVEVARLRNDRDRMRRHYEDVIRVLQAAFDHSSAPPSNTRYPDTKFLVLCTLEDRKGGAVTVGESGLLAAGVIAMVRAHGATDAALMWPQLSAVELTVLERLARDLAEAGEDG